jgi:hypothetical protein
VGYNRRDYFRCGIQRKSFFPLWDTTEKVFLHCGIQKKRIFSIVGCNGEQFQDGKQIFFYCTPQRRKFFFLCILHHNRILCSVLYPRNIFSIVSHNVAGFLPLYPAMEDIFLRFGIQWKRFFCCGIQPKKLSSIVGYNGRCFFPLWDTMEKNDTTKNDILKFLCASHCIQILI